MIHLIIIGLLLCIPTAQIAMEAPPAARQTQRFHFTPTPEALELAAQARQYVQNRINNQVQESPVGRLASFLRYWSGIATLSVVYRELFLDQHFLQAVLILEQDSPRYRDVCYYICDWARILAHYDTLSFFLSHAHDINNRSMHGITLLHEAVRDRQLGVIRFLLTFNPNINALTEGQTPLDLAYQLRDVPPVLTNRSEIIALLQQHGAFRSEALRQNQNRAGSQSFTFEAYPEAHRIVASVRWAHSFIEPLSPKLKAQLQSASDYEQFLQNHKASLSYKRRLPQVLFTWNRYRQTTILPDQPFLSDIFSLQAFLLLEQNSHHYNDLCKSLFFNGPPVTVRFFIENGYDPKHLRDGMTRRLHLSVNINEVEIVGYLIEHGASINMLDECGRTPLDIALNWNRTEIITLLKRHGALRSEELRNQNTKTKNLLHNTSTTTPVNLSAKITSAIESTRSDAKASCKQIFTSPASLQTLAANVVFTKPIMWDILSNDLVEKLHMLLQIKMLPERHTYRDLLLDEIRKYPVLVEVLLLHSDYAMKKNFTPALLFGKLIHWCPSLQLLEILVRHGIDITYHDRLGRTALHDAALTGNLKVAQLLLDHGAQVNAIDLVPSTHAENTPLDDAFYKFNESHDIVRLLRSRGALRFSEIEKQKQKERAERRARENHLIACAAVGDIATVKILLEQGVDINAYNDRGETALYLAARNSYLNMVVFLLNKGANINAQNMNGNTALMLAAGSRNSSLVCPYLSSMRSLTWKMNRAIQLL